LKRNNGYSVVFLALIGLMTLAYGFPEIASLRPQGLHQWRQADCLSITLNYAQDDLPFLEPELHYQTQITSGKGMSEFPIMYWFNGQLWKHYGQNEPMYRGLIFGLFLLALFRLHLKLKERDRWVSVLIPTLLFTSPILAYYGFNFINNVPAFSVAILGATYLYDYWNRQRIAPLVVGMLFIGLAGLLKITSAALFLTLIASYLATSITQKGFKKVPFQGVFLLLSLAVFATWFFWYGYANQYNEAIEFKPFLIGILPYWEASADLRMTIWANFKNWWFPRWLPLPLGLSSLLISFSLLFLWNRITRFFWFLNLFQILGWTAYFLLFFKVFDNHDYYLINSLVWPLTTWIIVFQETKKRSQKVKRVLAMTTLAFIISGIWITHGQMNWALTGWRNGHITKTQDFETIEPWLRDKGIGRTDLVLVVPDPSINISLYLMNQKGWTRFYTGLNNAKAIDERIDQGAKYLFVHTDEWREKEYLQPYMKNKVGRYGQIDVFKLPE